MLRKILIFCLAVAVNSAPAPDYYSLIETPTSRFEQKFLLSSPQLHEAYKVQPQQVKSHSEFQFPKQQQVLYYYPENNGNQQVAQNPEHYSYKVIGDNHAVVQQHAPQFVHYQPNGHVIYQQPQQVHYENLPHHAMNLHQVRQDTPWWQNIWNQVVSPEPEKEEKEEEERDIASLLEDTSSNNSSSSKVETNVDQAGRIESKDPFSDSSVFAGNPEEATTTPSLENSGFYDVRVDQAKAGDGEDSESVVIDSILRSAVSSSESEETSTEINEVTTEEKKVESTTLKLTSLAVTESTTEKPVAISEATIAKAAPKAANQEKIYFQQPEPYQRFYIAHGPPQFYGSADPNALIFSIQQLQPIVRTTGIKAGEEEKVTQFSMSSATEPSSALRIHVADEDEAREGSDIAPERVSTRSQLPADEQNSVVLKKEKEASHEDKREQSVIEGDSTKIHYD